jgi:hypothetical protein
MGSITRGLSNNITTGGVILPAGITNASVADVTSFANAANPANLVLISTQTASASASISFTSGLNSTYDEYLITFINIHPSADSAFKFNFSTDGGANYNVTKTSTMFRAYHFETDIGETLQYLTAEDLAQSTSDDFLNASYGSESDHSLSGYLQIFAPSSTTYVKHYIARVNGVENSGANDLTVDYYKAGYCNTTSAINAVKFLNSTGNIDDGIFKLYGVKKS